MHIVRHSQSLPNQPDKDDGISFHVTRDLTEHKFTVQSFSSPSTEHVPLGLDVNELIEFLVLDAGVGMLVGSTAAAWNACEKAVLGGWTSVVYPIALALTSALMLLPYLAVKTMVESGEWTADWAVTAFLIIAFTVLSPIWVPPLGAIGQAVLDALAGAPTPGLVAAAVNACVSPMAMLVLVLVGMWFLILSADTYFNGVVR